jgi:molybdate transport system ATP-binding protein
VTVVRADFSVTAGDFTVRSVIEAGPGITVLFGPSGSGKSLTLATIAGIRRPASGVIQIGGSTVADASRGIHMRTQDRAVGVVFQDSLLLPHRSVVDNVAMAVRSGSRADRRVQAEDFLSLVGASHLSAASPGRLSGGERQRVALARALGGGATVLLLDEPFSALDFQTRASLRTVLRSVVDSTGVAALLVTHDSEDAAELADATVAFQHGATVPSVPGFDRPAMSRETQH